MEISEAVEIAVVLCQADPQVEDGAILRDLLNCDIRYAVAIRVLQFVPIAFTRFLYRSSGIQFSEEYAVLS